MSGRILVVDDIATNRMLLRARLSAAYYDVIQAESGPEALQKAVEFQPDIVLLDVMMPGMDGFQTCRELKANPATAHIPVVMVTALCERADRLRGLRSGADDFLTRPINDLALLSRVRNLLRAKFMFDELRLRERTTRDLGLDTDPVETTPPPGRVMLLPGSRARGEFWRKSLTGQGFGEVTIPDNPAVLSPADMPDVFVIHAAPAPGRDGLRLVSQLRARPESRAAGIVLVVPEGDQVMAARGLDLGAGDHLFEPLDPAELIARIKGQLRRKQMSDRLRNSVSDSLRLAALDPLTGLFNRRYASRHLERIKARARRDGKGFALMMLDIDNFKQVNDRFGHAAGDRVLKEFAQRVQANLRGVDLVSRIGGEEFLVAMPDTSKAEARAASERLRRVIEATPFPCPGSVGGLPVTVSIGVTLGQPDSPAMEELIRQADRALYSAKARGRNTVTLFSAAA